MARPDVGKTRNGERFKNHFKKRNLYEYDQFFDDTTKALSHSVVLCDHKPDDEIIRAMNAEVMTFEDAMTAVQHGELT
jgi:hypothetical protein